MSIRKLIYSLAAAAFAVSAYGQAVPSREPSSTHIFPAGGERGTTVKVRVGGECLPPGMGFKLYGEGLKAPDVLGAEVKARYEPSVRRPPRDADGVGAASSYPREWSSKIQIAANAEIGARHWRAFGAWGGTRPRPFIVGELPEFIETEPNSLPERAESIKLPIVLNGQIAGERDQDFFEFTAKANEVVVCDMMAARIGSPLDPVITITDARGSRIENQSVRVGADLVLAFKVPADGNYRIHVANLGFPGGPAFVYRITLSTQPYIAFAFPSVGKVGSTKEMELYTLTGTGAFNISKENVAFPAKAGPFLHRGVSLVASEETEIAEASGNQSAATAMQLPIPVAVSGRFLNTEDEDWYSFKAKKGESFTIACRAFPFDSSAMPNLVLQDSTGAALATANSSESGDRTSELDWNAPGDGDYRLRLRDLQHGTRGGPDFSYRLSIAPARPDFSLRIDPDCVNVVQGGKTEIDVVIRRIGGFAGPIALKATGLPDGSKIEPTTIPAGVPRIKLAISAKDDTRPTDAIAHLVGTAHINKSVVERGAVVSSIGHEASDLFVTIQHKPLFRVSCNEAYQYAHRGTIYPYALTIERLNGFSGPITLQVCDRQVQDLDGIDVVESIIAANAKESPALVNLPETMHASVQHHSRPYVQAHATFVDKWGQKQTMLAICEKRCMIRTLPPIVKLRAESKGLVVSPGKPVECQLVLDRTSNFAGPAVIELVESSGFHAEKLEVKDGVGSFSMHVHLDDAKCAAPELRFRMTGKLPSGVIAVSETRIPIRLR